MKNSIETKKILLFSRYPIESALKKLLSTQDNAVTLDSMQDILFENLDQFLKIRDKYSDTQ